MAVRQWKIATTNDGTNSPLIATFDTAVAAGSTVVAFVASHQYAETAGNVASVKYGTSSDGSGGTAFTNRVALEDVAASTAWLDAWDYIDAPSGAMSVRVGWKVSNANNKAALVIVELSGVQTSPRDVLLSVQGGYNATSTAIGPTSALAQADEDALLVVGGQLNGLALQAGTSWALLTSYQMSGDNKGILVAHREPGSTAALSGTVLHNTGSGIAAILSYKRAVNQRIKALVEDSGILGTTGWYGRVFSGSTQVAQYTGGKVEATADSSGRAVLLITADGMGLANGASVTVTGESSTATPSRPNGSGIVGEASATVESGTI